jgi:hypothetical protein
MPKPILTMPSKTMRLAFRDALRAEVTGASERVLNTSFWSSRAQLPNSHTLDAVVCGTARAIETPISTIHALPEAKV